VQTNVPASVFASVFGSWKLAQRSTAQQEGIQFSVGNPFLREVMSRQQMERFSMLIADNVFLLEREVTQIRIFPSSSKESHIAEYFWRDFSKSLAAIQSSTF